MKNFTKELKAILKEDPGVPIMSPDEVIGRANTMVVLTNQAPRKLLALAGPSRKAILLNFKPLMIAFNSLVKFFILFPVYPSQQ